MQTYLIILPLSYLLSGDTAYEADDESLPRKRSRTLNDDIIEQDLEVLCYDGDDDTTNELVNESEYNPENFTDSDLDFSMDDDDYDDSDDSDW